MAQTPRSCHESFPALPSRKATGLSCSSIWVSGEVHSRIPSVTQKESWKDTE